MVSAAVLQAFVQVKGVREAAGDLRGLDGDLRKTAASAGGATKNLEDTGRRGSKSLGALKVAAGALAGVAVFDTLKRGVGAAVAEFEEARKVGALTTQTIKSTGGAANVTAKQVADLAGAISKKTGIDDEAIQSGANLLLTFKNVRNETGKGRDVFNQATKAAVDLSAAGFGDLTSTSKQLGKALNDPIKGMSALGRSGVTFSEDQKKAIEALMATGKAGDRVKAQQMILKEVQSQVGGAAAAQATSLDKLKVTLGNVAEAAGAVLVPAFDKAARFVSTLLNQMMEGQGAGGALISVFRTTGTVLGTVIGVISSVVGWFRQHETVTLALAAAVGVALAAFAGFQILAAVQAAIVAVRGAMIALNTAFLTNPIVLVVAGLAALVAAFVVAYRESETFRNIIDTVWSAIKTVATAVWDFVSKLDEMPGKLLAVGTAVAGAFLDGVKAIPAAIIDAGKWVIDRVVDGVKASAAAVGDAATWLGNRLVDLVKAAPGKLLDLGKWVVNRFTDGFKTITEALAGIGGWLLNRVVEFVEAAPGKLLDLGKWTVNRYVDGFKTITEALGSVGGWLLNRVVEIVKEAPEKLGDLGGWVLNRVVDGIKTITEGLKGVGGWLKNRLVDSFDAVKDSIVGVGGTVIGWIVEGLKTGLRAVGGFVNKIISVVNKIPGVDINPINLEGLAKGGSVSRQGVDTMQAVARGGIVNHPIVMMGEEAPRHPEYVIPTNPAYRGRAKGLLAQAAGAIGYAKGGVLGAIAGGAKSIIGNLPGTGSLPGWLKGMGSYALAEVTKWIKDNVTDIFTGKLKGGGGGYPGAPGGKGIVALGRQLQRMGFAVGEHPAFGSVGRHAPGSYHYSGRAIDVNADTMPGGEMANLDRLYRQLRGMKGIVELLWRVEGHFDHLHVAMRKGGIIGAGAPFVGSYAAGGTVPRDGYAYVHRGEEITPRGAAAGPLVHIEHQHVTDGFDAEAEARRLAFLIETA